MIDINSSSGMMGQYNRWARITEFEAASVSDGTYLHRRCGSTSQREYVNLNLCCRGSPTFLRVSPTICSTAPLLLLLSLLYHSQGDV